MNTKSLLTRIAVPVLSLGLLGGLGAALATSADAATLPAATTAAFHQASGVTHLTDRDDGGNGSLNGGNWALDDMNRYLTIKLTGVSGGVYTYTATIRDAGQFHAVLGDDTPNQSGSYAGELITNKASGPINGYVNFSFTANSLPTLDSHGNLAVPAAINGDADSTSAWYEIAFPAGTTFGGAGINNSTWTWSYHALVRVGSHLVPEHWTDAASNNAGDNPSDGNIN
jgi:hypothetical protein